MIPIWVAVVIFIIGHFCGTVWMAYIYVRNNRKDSVGELQVRINPDEEEPYLFLALDISQNELTSRSGTWIKVKVVKKQP